VLHSLKQTSVFKTDQKTIKRYTLIILQLYYNQAVKHKNFEYIPRGK